MNINQILYWT